MFGHDDNNTDSAPADQFGPRVGGNTGPATTAVDDNSASPAFTSSAPSDDNAVPEPLDDPTPVVSVPSVKDPSTSVTANSLIDIKQDALKQLSPLVGHLEQTPEERFRTTMMMIQASDDQSLIKDAYAAAQAIPDEKIRAQALLDIVNEINYFTQHTS